MQKNKKIAAEPKYHHGDLRRAIMQAALQLVEESGLQHLSLREIARKIGVTTAAPYHHFKDRQALLIQITIQGYGQLLQTLESARASAKGDQQELGAETRAYLQFAQQHAALYAVMFSSELTNHGSVELRTAADSCLAVLFSSIVKFGELEKQKIAEAALCVWSMLHGLIVLDQNNMLEEERSEQQRIAVEGVLNIVRGFSKSA
jgi:AcrR family transcriptional regulator